MTVTLNTGTYSTNIMPKLKSFLLFPAFVALAILGGLFAAICLVFMITAGVLDAIATTIKERYQ